MSKNPLDTLFNPKAIAIVGASDRASSWTREIYFNLKAFGFPGPIFPINPGRSTVWEERAYPSLKDAPDVDLAVVAIPAPAAVAAVLECGEAGVPAAMVVSSGFRDAGPDGARLQEQLAAAAKSADVVLLGPNLEGFINYHGRVAAYGAEMPRAPATGSISMFSQSGTAAWTFAHMAGDRHVGTRLVTGVGVEATLGVGELLAWAAADPETRVVACYIEAVRDFDVLARGFEALAEAGKRFVVCCPRISGEAARASAVAHTGELLGDTTLRDAAFRRLGAAVVHDPIALFETALLLASAPLSPSGDQGGETRRSSGRVAVAMQSGGNCTMFTDALVEAEIAVEPFSPETLGKLKDILPTFSEPRNPLDLTGQAIFDTEIYRGAIDVLADDPEVGMVVIDVAPSRHDPDGSVCTEILRHAAEVQRSSEKPVLSVLATPLSYPGRTVAPFADASLAILHGHAAAAAAIAELFRSSAPRREIAKRTVAPADVLIAPGVLDEVAAAELLSAYGIERPREALARTPEQAAEAAGELDGPVVVKLVCAEVPHKAREGLVKLGLATPEEAESAAREIQDRARQLGVDDSRLLVQEQLASGPEVLLGVSVDPIYGPAMTVRPGGGDVAGESVFHLLPLRQGEAAQMAKDAASGLSEPDLARLADAVDRLSWLAVDLSAQLLEIEANPILVSGGRAVAVDALAVATDKK